MVKTRPILNPSFRPISHLLQCPHNWFWQLLRSLTPMLIVFFWAWKGKSPVKYRGFFSIFDRKKKIAREKPQKVDESVCKIIFCFWKFQEITHVKIILLLVGKKENFSVRNVTNFARICKFCSWTRFSCQWRRMKKCPWKIMSVKKRAWKANLTREKNGKEAKKVSTPFYAPPPTHT